MGIDAFGRSTDETGDGSSARETPGARSGSPIAVPGWFAALLIAVIGLGGTAVFLVRAERENRDDPLQQAQRGEIRNLGARSLLRADRLPAAYAAATARMRPGEVVTGMTVSPVGLELTVRDQGAFQRQIRTDVALGTSRADSGRSESDGLAPAKLDVRGVEPAVRRVLDRVEEDTAQVDGVFLNLTTQDGVAKQSEWRIQLDEVRPRDTTWYARTDGRVVRRSDEDSAITRPELRPSSTPAPIPTSTPTTSSSSSSTTSSSSVTIVRNGKRVKLSRAKTRRLQRCLGAAAGDRPAFTRCLAEAGL